MTFSSLQIIQLRAPTFATDLRINSLLDMAALEIGSEPALQTQREKAIALLVMHWMTLEQRGNGVTGTAGAGGSITSESEGQLSRSYGGVSVTISDKYPDLASTSFGLELVGLYKKTIFCARTRMV